MLRSFSFSTAELASTFSAQIVTKSNVLFLSFIFSRTWQACAAVYTPRSLYKPIHTRTNANPFAESGFSLPTQAWSQRNRPFLEPATSSCSPGCAGGSPFSSSAWQCVKQQANACFISGKSQQTFHC